MDKTSDCNLVNAHLRASCIYPDMPVDTIEYTLRKYSIVINKKGNIEATEWIFHEKEDSNSISDNCSIEAFFNLKDILAFPAWKEGTPHEMISFSVFYGISHCQIRPLHCQDG